VADPNERSEPDSNETDLSEGEALPAEPKAAAPKKKAKASADPEEIRDRNKRIREEAAAKRRGKREVEERRVAPARNLDTSEIVDDALARSTHAAAGWLKRNFNVVQWTILLGIVGGVGYQIYKYRHGISVAKVTDELTRAVEDERARVGAGESTPDQYTGLSDTRPTFPSEEARLKAAADSYTKVQSTGSPTTSALASLGLAGILYDQGKYKDARAQYEKVKNSVLASKDQDARARAIEGIGLSSEANGDADAALAAFKELGNSDAAALAALGEYHQARLLVKKGQVEPAKALLKKAIERLSKLEDPEKKAVGGGGSFLEQQVKQLLGTIDPSAVPKPAGGLTPEQLERIQAQLKVSGDGKMDQKKLQEMLQKLAAPKGPSPSPAPTGSAP
jgi:tetratricopeptide (TPR) repeat protein